VSHGQLILLKDCGEIANGLVVNNASEFDHFTGWFVPDEPCFVESGFAIPVLGTGCFECCDQKYLNSNMIFSVWSMFTRE